MNFKGPVTEYSVKEKNLTNHQRIKDREMERATYSGSTLPFLPTRSRMRRAHTSRKQLETAYEKHLLEVGDAERLPMPAAPDVA